MRSAVVFRSQDGSAQSSFWRRELGGVNPEGVGRGCQPGRDAGPGMR